MYKKVTVDQVIKVEKQELSCDLCEEVIPEDSCVISIEPAMVRDSGGRWRINDHTLSRQPTRIDICSTECLTKNAGAAGLLLNSKMIPELRQARSAYDRQTEKMAVAESPSYKSSIPGGVDGSYPSYPVRVTI